MGGYGFRARMTRMNGYPAEMDIQNWLIPLLSLVGGAGGAAIINTIYGMKKQKQDRIDEHARWLRDKRQEAYLDFFESTRRVLNLAVATKSGDDSGELDKSLDQVNGSPIRLLAPVEIQAAAELARDDVSLIVEAARSGDTTSVDALYVDVKARRKTLVELCRADLEQFNCGK